MSDHDQREGIDRLWEEVHELLRDRESEPHAGMRLLAALAIGLCIEPAWSVDGDDAMAWWPGRHRQRCSVLPVIETIVDRKGPRFMRRSPMFHLERAIPCPTDVRAEIHGLRIETDVLRDVSPSDALFDALSRFNEHGTGSALVWNPADRRVSLLGTIRVAVTEDCDLRNPTWWGVFLATAQAGQSVEAAETICEALVAAGEGPPIRDESPHPLSGMRTERHGSFGHADFVRDNGRLGSVYGMQDVSAGCFEQAVGNWGWRGSHHRHVAMLPLPVPPPVRRCHEPAYDDHGSFRPIPGRAIGCADARPEHPMLGAGCRLRITVGIEGGAGPRQANRLNLLRHLGPMVRGMIEEEGSCLIPGGHHWIEKLGVGAWHAAPQGRLRLSLFAPNMAFGSASLPCTATGFDRQARWASRLLHGLIDEHGHGDWSGFPEDEEDGV